MRGHNKLRAFKLADEVVLLLYLVTRDFPKEETFGLTSQMRRAAVSVPSNIVEGYARETIGDYLRFLSIAFGSLRELKYQVNLSKRLNFISRQHAIFIEPKIEEAEKVLNGLIRSLRKKVTTISHFSLNTFNLQPTEITPTLSDNALLSAVHAEKH